MTDVALLLPELEELIRQPAEIQQHAPALLSLTANAVHSNEPIDWVPRLTPEAPLAAYSRSYDNNDAGHSNWLRADPVVLQADLNRVHLLAINRHGLTVEQVDQIVRDLQPLFADERLNLTRGEADGAHERWYVSSEKPLPPAFMPPVAALGNPLEDFLISKTSQRDSAIWQRLQTETQMLLHQHPVNDQRRAAGLLPVNSLWFWGAGKLPNEPAQSIPDVVWAMSPELAGWCKWLKIEEQGFARRQTLVDWLTKNLSSQTRKILLEFRLQRQFSLEQNLLALNELMKTINGRLQNLRLHICTENDRSLTVVPPGLVQRLFRQVSQQRGLKYLSRLVL